MKWQFHEYGFIVGLAIVVGWWWAEKLAKEWGVGEKQMNRAFGGVLVGGLLGARGYHVVDYWEYYENHLGEIVAVWQGGLAIFGALIGGLIGLGLAVRNREERHSILVAGLMAMPLAQAIGRLGNWVNRELYGWPTTLPWGIAVDDSGIKYHPLFAYEAGLNLLLFGLLNFGLPKRLRQVWGGGLYLLGYGIIRFSLEPLRLEAMVLSRLMALGIIVVGIIWIRMTKR